MYGRRYGDKELRFEPSGGLMHAALVMRDKETDSFWSIMSGSALSGELKGSALVELPNGVKTQWKAWREEHPETLVLSVDGVEHDQNNPYDKYFTSAEGFRGSTASDQRLATKEPIFAFQHQGKPYAVPLAKLEDGAAFEVDGMWAFLYRPRDAAMFFSTSAWRSDKGFEQREEGWHDTATGARFDPAERRFVTAGDQSDQSPRPLSGFDTFWFNWSMTHPRTEILTAAP